MRLRDISYAFKVAADVARAGEQLVGSFDRSRGRMGSVLIGVGMGVGLGALLFSESARARVRAWIAAEKPVVAHMDGHDTVEPAAPPH